MPAAPISKKEQKLEDALVALYEAIDNAAEAGAKMLRARLPAVMSDYALVVEVEEDLAALPKDRIDKYPIISAFKTLVNGKRKSFWESEIENLNQKWVASGGRYLGDDQIDTVLKMLGNGESLIRGGAAVFSEALGISVDPSGLNSGLDDYSGGKGQISFMAALAVVSGKVDWNLSTLPKEASKSGVAVKQLGWKIMPIDWRRGWVITRDLGTLEKGLEGYKKFAREKADGAMLKGYSIASALLSAAEFRELGWGKAIPLQVEEVAGLQNLLRADLSKEESVREYRGLEGYKKFARENADGAMQKGYSIASALLSAAEFRELGWGKAIFLQVEEVAGLQNLLRADLKREESEREYRGLEGYKKFAREKADGAMQKVYSIASALLSVAEFRELGWGKAILLQVEEVAGLQNLLRADLKREESEREYRGLEGYKKFAREKADGAMDKGYKIASALLCAAEFRELGWGKAIHLQVEEVAGLQDLLRADLSKAESEREYKGLEGYKKFAREKADGAMAKGYSIASALLSAAEFRELSWGKAIHLQVEEVAGLQNLLRADLKREESERAYRGLEGYKKFSREQADGAMAKGYNIASALLSAAEFRELGWGKAIPLQVEEVAGLQDLLRADLSKAESEREYKGLEGYKKFTREKADGSMLKGYSIASALLSVAEFRELGWGKTIPLQVEEVAIAEKYLKESHQTQLMGLAGLQLFAERFDISLQSALQTGRALLTEEQCDALGWSYSLLGIEEVEEDDLDLEDIDDTPEVSEDLQDKVEEADINKTKNNKSPKNIGLASWLLPIITSLGLLAAANKAEAEEKQTVLPLMPQGLQLKVNQEEAEVINENPEEMAESDLLTSDELFLDTSVISLSGAGMMRLGPLLVH